MLTSYNHKALYIGITSGLIKRIYEHKNGETDGFTKKYNVKYLVYYEIFNDPENAILREKQLKRWRRSKKETLINNANPSWRDLYEEIL